MTAIQWLAPDEDAMEKLGEKLRDGFNRDPSGIVYLLGDLGMGKTTLSRAIIRAYGWTEAVKSPTYTLVESYALNAIEIHHFDLYRISDPEELEYLGLDSYFDGNSLALIEWPERGVPILPPADLTIQLTEQDQGRALALKPHSDKGRSWCQDW